MSAGYGFSNPETGRPALVGRMIDEPALAIDKGVDQSVHSHHTIHSASPSSRDEITK
jgi:hypothetical protein